MKSPRLPLNWRNLADLIASTRSAFEIRPARPNVEAMQNDREPGRFTRNPSPFRGLTLWRSAPSFLPWLSANGPLQHSLIPVSPQPHPRPGVTPKTCGPLRSGPANMKRTDHV